MTPLILTLALLFPLAAPSPPTTEAERLRTAKALFFDRKYAEARQAWQEVFSRSRGAQADQAAFSIARCSENLGEHDRALKEYADFLARRPADQALAEEARTNRVGLAARLYKAGRRQHLVVMTDGLRDPSPSVRYYAALQLAAMGAEAGRQAVPLLCRLVAEGTDQDLVERAKLALLRLDPDCLARAPGPTVGPSQGEARSLRLRIFERGHATPKLTITIPVVLAEMLFKSLPEDVLKELRQEGYDAENLLERLKKLGPMNIIDIRGDEGERIQIWLE